MMREFAGRGIGDGGRGSPTVAHTTTLQIPSSMAAAARHTMPTADAPPRSVRSAKLTFHPQYSASVAGTNMLDSTTSPAQTMPSTSDAANPASASASAASPAHCSTVRRGVPANFRCDGRSAKPTMLASPRSPMVRG